MTAVTQTDRPKSVRNCCAIKVLVAFFMLSRCFFDFSVGVGSGAFVIVLSQISSFFSQKQKVCDVEIEIISFVVNVSVKLTIPPIDSSKSK